MWRGLVIARAGVAADGPWTADNTATITGLLAGGGLGVGMAIDALITKQRTVYAKALPSGHVTVVPLLSGSRNGVLLSLRF